VHLGYALRLDGLTNYMTIVINGGLKMMIII